jgi:hypothetical protein
LEAVVTFWRVSCAGKWYPKNFDLSHEFRLKTPLPNTGITRKDFSYWALEEVTNLKNETQPSSDGMGLNPKGVMSLIRNSGFTNIRISRFVYGLNTLYVAIQK